MTRLLQYLWLIGILQIPFVVYFFIRFLENRKQLIPYVHNPLPEHIPYLIFQITTKSGPPVVQEVIDRIHEVSARHNFTNYRVDVVVDKEVQFRGANVLVVPESYRTPKGSRFKCRAMQYAVEWRRNTHEDGANTWIMHLDEESFVTDHLLISVTKYLAGSDPAPVAEGPINYPNKLLQVPALCQVVESMRPYICYDCVTQMKGQLPIHMHGSNLLVRSDVEDVVGWDYRNPASEDQRFGHEVWLKYGSTAFAWHGGLLEEQPPLTLSSLMKQRRRWFVGNLYNIRTGDIPLIKKLEISTRWLSWGIGFIASLAAIATLLVPQQIDTISKIVLTTITVMWLFSYQEGLRINLKSLNLSTRQRVWLHLKTLVLSPIAGILETYAAFSAPFYVKNFSWTPTEK